MSSDHSDMTLPRLLQLRAHSSDAGKTALRRKSRGIWQCCSWQQYYESVQNLALGLRSFGFAAGEKLAIISTNRPEALFVQLATQAAGGVPVCLYHDATPQEIADAVSRFDVTFAVAENQEQVDKLLEHHRDLPALRRIVSIQDRGMRSYRNELLAPFTALQERGAAEDPEQFTALLSSAAGDDAALICLTSGTTGTPKGAVLSHTGLIAMGRSLNEADPKRPRDEYVSLLPLAWFGEQLMTVVAPLHAGYTVNFPEKQETAMADLREIGPHCMLSRPKTWETLASSVRVRMMDSTPFKKFMFRTCMPIGERYADCILAGTAPPLMLRARRWCADILLFRALRDRLGLSRVRSALSGGGSPGETVVRFFHAIGVNLKQTYGLTELSGLSCMHRDGAIRGGSVGEPLSGTALRIAPDGEIQVQGGGMFPGYYGDDEATRQAFTEDGWFKTGDAGTLDEQSHLVVSGRLQEVLVLPDGSRFSTQKIENTLRFSPYISEAVVFCDGSSPPVALISIASRVVGTWAGSTKLSFTSFADLTSRQEVVDLIAGEVTRANGDLPPAARISRFAIIYKELDADEGELTRNGAVRRHVITDLYADLIAALHSGAESVAVDTSIVFSDGKTGHIATTVTIRPV